MWIINPGNDKFTPDPSLDPHTVVNIRFRDEDYEYSDTGQINEWYWQIDDDFSDIVEYQIIKE